MSMNNSTVQCWIHPSLIAETEYFGSSEFIVVHSFFGRYQKHMCWAQSQARCTDVLYMYWLVCQRHRTPRSKSSSHLLCILQDGTHNQFSCCSEIIIFFFILWNLTEHTIVLHTEQNVTESTHQYPSNKARATVLPLQRKLHMTTHNNTYSHSTP